MFVEFQYYTTSGAASQELSFNFFTPSGGLPPLNVEFAQHYLQCKSITSFVVPRIGHRIQPDQLSFILLDNHSIYSKPIK